jgi:hypothetical protein
MLAGDSSQWMQYRSAVWVSEKFGIAARTQDGRWFAYPYGGTELGPFTSLDEARRRLEKMRAELEARS